MACKVEVVFLAKAVSDVNVLIPSEKVLQVGTSSIGVVIATGAVAVELPVAVEV